MKIENFFKTKPASSYTFLTSGGTYNIKLNKEEACVALKIHDYGVDAITDKERIILHSLIGKLKEKIWP
ncbi:hypothetical protein [Lacimicrobium alkaliphilum]|uniref:Uncharacterized protein n=1 Tax=Lacimicrobium alkaliphilum TaxID=1526571 RepID=A0A0U2RKI8_9ALTE|nr:hypothetical protein [Lacimicrobium alkaliphilum]ALS97786.1 hypothetical protein AT746_05520 [Lacimicrobium alkaliphilum]